LLGFLPIFEFFVFGKENRSGLVLFGPLGLLTNLWTCGNSQLSRRAGRIKGNLKLCRFILPGLLLQPLEPEVVLPADVFHDLSVGIPIEVETNGPWHLVDATVAEAAIRDCAEALL